MHFCMENELLLQDDDVAPPRRGVLATEVVLDGIGEDVGLASAVLARVLLRAEDDRFGAVDFIDAVDDAVQAPHLLELFGVDVEKVLLDRRVGHDAHHNHTCLLILVTFTENGFQHIAGGLHDGCR